MTEYSGELITGCWRREELAPTNLVSHKKCSDSTHFTMKLSEFIQLQAASGIGGDGDWGCCIQYRLRLPHRLDQNISKTGC